jgi:hypothetical protein
MTTATTTTATTNIQISIEKVIVLFASLIALTFSLHAQNIQDVLRVYVNGNGYSDEAIVRFHENATTGYDFDFDAYKMFSFNEDVPQIYTLANETEEFAINTLPSLTAETSVSLNVEVGISGTYSIRVNFSDFNDDVRVILEDSKNGNMVDLRAEMTYSTTFEVTDNADRFVLHFIPSSSVSNGTSYTANNEEDSQEQTTSIEENNTSANIYTAGNTVKVDNFSGQVSIYNINGEEVASTSSEGSVELNVSTTGYYIVAVSSNGTMSTQKVYVK